MESFCDKVNPQCTGRRARPRTPPGTKDSGPGRLRASRGKGEGCRRGIAPKPWGMGCGEPRGARRERGVRSGRGPAVAGTGRPQRRPHAGRVCRRSPGSADGEASLPPGTGAAGWLPQVTAFEPWKWVWTASSCGPDGQGLEGLSDLPDAPGLVSPEAEDEPSSC